jgi:hypothetical protein
MSKRDQQFYAYYDTIEETGEVIYCGKGDNHRSDIDKSPKRNKLYNDYTKNKKIVRTRIPTLDEDLALKLEDWLMIYYHTWLDDPLSTKHACNIDGPGTNGRSKTKSKESIEKQRQTVIGRVSPLKGKTHTEIYGEARAKEISVKISKTLIENNTIKGKTNVELYGEEKAREMSDKLSKALKGKTYIELFGEDRAKEINKAKSKSVIKINRITNETIMKYDSMSLATRQTGISNISSCCKGKRPHAGGYIWRFA